MFLKRLELQGFKSFVDKTVLEFGSGITAVVGPNGSGKSNISDAVRWVLGEQSPKLLRGTKMEDLIFAGTENRRSVGFAEVSIIIDNNDGALNIEYSEVKVTRRLYRSGESEFQINGSSCRLKDVHILFADTGVGRDGYSIISQGRVDEILSGKSDERRNIFEDATGIMKYRMRKQDSERKLASTETNLLRINDIISELEFQIAPLTKQAEVAKKYLSLKYELRDIEVGVLVDGTRRIHERLSEINTRLSEINEQIQTKEICLLDERTNNESKSEISHVLEMQLNEARDKGFEVEKSIERLSSSIKLNEERVQSIKENNQRIQNDLNEFDGRKNELNKRISEIEIDIKKCSDDLEAATKARQNMQQRYEEIIGLLSEDAAKADITKNNLQEKKMEIQKRYNAIEGLKQQNLLFEKRKEEIISDSETLNNEKEKISEQFKIRKAEEQEFEEKLEENKQLLETSGYELQNIRDIFEKNKTEISNINSDIKSKDAKLRLLKDMEASYEGYARSVKEILSLCKENKTFGTGIYGAVAQLINVPAQYELAVETALGNAYQNIVTKSEEQAKQAIEYLKEKKLGRATFLPISAVTGKTLENDTINELKRLPGFIGLASQLPSFDKAYQNIVDNLLGRIATFTNLDTAVAAARKFKYAFYFVTLDGEFLRPTGAITGGSQEIGRRTGALTRTREIPLIEKEMVILKGKFDNLNILINENKEKIISMESSQTQTLDFVRKLEVKYTEAKSACENMREKLSAYTEREEKLLLDLDNQDKSIDLNIEAIASFNKNIETFEEELSKLQIELSLYENKAAEGIEVRNTLINRINEYKLIEAGFKNNFDNYNETLTRLKSDIENIDEKNGYYTSQTEEGSSQIEILEKDNISFANMIQTLSEEKEINSNLINKLTEQKHEVDENLSGMIDRITSINEELSKLKEELGRLEIKKIKNENEEESNKVRLWDEYELTYNKALELVGDVKIENYGMYLKKISELKSGIRQLGTVNVDSIEALETTQTRFNFLNEQRNDMEQSKQKMQRVITEVNHVMKEQFVEQFKLIRKNFQDVFSDLFDGGKADIILTDEADVLECGIEIQVQPPGKKLQNMMLLSGGERALTAIALLFAILKMHPTPFCLLDEIEAALDEANVYRFSNFIKTITDATQFILVTHKKGTMETANSIYGVTMEVKGISRVVSMKMEQQ